MLRVAFAGLLLPLAGCATTVIHERVDAQRLAAAPAAAMRGPALRCAYRLDGVADAREASQSGGLGRKAFEFPDAAEVVRRQLTEAGFAGVDAGGIPGVQVKIRQLYLTQNTITKVPVAVYEVTVSTGERFVVRAQPASMNWAGSIDEAYAAYRTAMHDANRQTVERLNAACAMRASQGAS